MRAFYHPEQALHDPQVFMRAGVLAAPTDLPERTARLLAALDRHGITTEASGIDGRVAAARVHTERYLHFLETAHVRWKEIPNSAAEVFPNISPYWNASPDRDARPDCPTTNIIGEAGYYMGDGAVAIGPLTHVSAFRSAATAAAAAQAVAGGEAAAYALCRPSGHHCRADQARGFCYLANAAIAVEMLRERFGKVATLDVDAHHGDGTQDIFYRRDDVFNVSVHVDPTQYYPWFIGFAHETGHGKGAGYNLNLPLAVGADDDAFLAAVEKGLAAIANFGAEALVLSLGYDAHAEDPLTALRVSTPGFYRLGEVVRRAGLPTVIVQEGGYGIEVIGDCLDAFLTGFGK